MLCTRQKSSKILHLSPELISSLLSCFSTISVGSFLSFSIYSTQFGVLNSLSKIQVSQLVQFSNGGFFLVGPIVGLLIDKLKVFKFSRFVFHWFGAFLLCTCYCILALFRLEFSVLLVLFAGIGIGTAVIYHKTLSVNSQNVTSAKGVGLPLCAFGIASLFYSVIASLLFYTDGILNISQFLLFLGIFAGSINFIVPFFFYVWIEKIPESIETNKPKQSAFLFFKSLDAYLLAITFFSVSGVGFLQINNIGTILAQLVLNPQGIQNTHVKIISACDFSGRVTSMIVLDYLPRVPKITWLAVSVGFAFTGCLFGITQDLSFLYGASVCLGYGFGMLWPVVPTLLKDFYGTERFSTHWGALTVLPTLAIWLAGFFVAIGINMGRVDIGYFAGVGLCAIACLSVILLSISRNRRKKNARVEDII